MAFGQIGNFIKNRADFYTDLAEALDDRASLVSEIQKYRSVALRKNKKKLAEMYGVWLARLDRGSFTESISTTMPQSDLMVLQAFEVSGKLSDGLRFLSEVVTKSNKMKSTMKKAVVMPIMLTIFIGAMFALVGLFMVPILEEIYPHEQWPMMGQILYPVSMIVKNYGIFIAAFIALSLAAFFYSIPRWKGDKRNFLDSKLPYSIFRDYNGSLFLTSLAALLKGGTSLVDALISIRAISSNWMNWHISKMLIALDDESAEPAKAINTGVIPEDIADRIIAYGERSSFIEAMSKIGLQSMDKTEVKISNSAKAINTFMLLSAGLFLALMISGVILTSMHAEVVIRESLRN